MPEQIVQVAGDPQALLRDGELGELLARLVQLAVGRDLAPEGRHHRADREDHDRKAARARLLAAPRTTPSPHADGRRDDHGRGLPRLEVDAAAATK